MTFVGRPGPLVDAMQELAAAAMEKIDLRRQTGVHPRVGALDVAPFVPLGSASMASAVEAAHELGQRLASELGIPTLAYAEAALHPDRRRLEVVRRGGLEGLVARMRDDGWQADWAPMGEEPGTPHPSAGVTLVGARDFLVAFNVLLDTEELAIARAVARVVRESSGGLPTVKAIGVPLTSRGVVQVSLNLTDLTTVSPTQAFTAVRTEARRHGVDVLASERIGLFPRAALDGVRPEDLLLENPDPMGSLEDRLESLGLEL